jgi:hypothetical protein
LRCDRYMIAMRLQHDRDVIATRSLCDCNAIVM